MTDKEKTFKVRPAIEVELTRQDIDDIMCAALEGGICYWCRKAEVVGDYLGEYAHEQIARGGVLMLHDAESANAWELNREKFLNGVKLYFEQGCHVCVEENRIDTCDVDGNDADCIIQFALFGEVVFG